MPLLIASLAALAVGPVLHRAARRMPSALAALDGFMVVALVGLVLLQVLPLAVGSAGWAAIGAAGAGLAAPGLLERSRWRRARTASRRGVEVLALAGLALHAVADGVTLAVDDGHGAGPGALAMAVLLHQVPAGLGI
ncbi:hypothetical protein L6R50_26790, partial [Myxococcota bacterium]|nr:hypothetical protein [Myxococcota bacterium]